MLFDLSIFMKLISYIGNCQNYGADVSIMHQIDEKNVFATCLKYPVMKIVADVNQKLAKCMQPWRHCGYMNMPPPMNQTTCDDIITRLHSSYMKLANNNMKAAADQIRHENLGDGYS